MSNKLVRFCLLVRFKDLAETETQNILETALKHEIIPTSNEGIKNSYIFEASKVSNLSAFYLELKSLNIKMV